MNLYILRHASAGLRRSNPLLDIKRPLDKEGKKHCLQLAYVLNALNIQFDFIVSSATSESRAVPCSLITRHTPIPRRRTAQ